MVLFGSRSVPMVLNVIVQMEVKAIQELHAVLFWMMTDACSDFRLAMDIALSAADFSTTKVGEDCSPWLIKKFT